MKWLHDSLLLETFYLPSDKWIEFIYIKGKIIFYKMRVYFFCFTENYVMAHAEVMRGVYREYTLKNNKQSIHTGLGKSLDPSKYIMVAFPFKIFFMLGHMVHIAGLCLRGFYRLHEFNRHNQYIQGRAKVRVHPNLLWLVAFLWSFLCYRARWIRPVCFAKNSAFSGSDFLIINETPCIILGNSEILDFIQWIIQQKYWDYAWSGMQCWLEWKQTKSH